MPPTFESGREVNEFNSRLLLHHFLDDNDQEWLKQFENFAQADSQKQALIFVREVGAIDNTTYRQMADCDTLKASNDLRLLRNHNLLKSKGKGKATYYVASDGLRAPVSELSTPPPGLSTPPNGLSTPPPGLSTPPPNLSTPPPGIFERIGSLNNREHDNAKVEAIIMDLCEWKPLKASEIAGYFQKEETYFKRKYFRSCA